MRTIKILIGFAVLVAAVVSRAAWANNGTHLTGYGAKAQGMGGASIALPQDAVAAANNPAGMAFVGNRFDIGTQIVWIKTDSTFGELENRGSSLTPVPEFGVNWQINERLSFGMSSAPSGAAMYYDDQLYTGASDGTRGLYLVSVILPTVSYKVNEKVAVGLSLAGAAHALEIDNFPGVPTEDMKWSTGYGWRGGLMLRPHDDVSLGIMYASKIKMGSLDGYKDDILATVDGKLDVPEQYGLGIALGVTSNLTVALDYLRFNWEDTQWKTLFGYRNQDVFRVGVSYDLNSDWTLRGGASFARRQIASEHTAANLLVSAINSNAYSLGASRRFSGGAELTVGAEYDYGDRLDGSGASTGSSIDTETVVFSLSYGKKF